MKLYLDTSVLGAVLDQEDARRVAASNAVLQSIAARDHIGVISNVVQEELEQAPDHVETGDPRRARGYRVRARPRKRGKQEPVFIV